MSKIKLVLFVVVLIVSSAVHADLKIANDPATLAIGARALGMGGVFLNNSDISALFGNPAALTGIQENQYSMMAGKFVNEVDYLSLSTVIPTNMGVFGIAYLNSQITYSGPAATTEVVDGIRIIPSTSEVANSSYRNSAVYLSFGKPAKELINNSLLENMQLGGTLKIFSQDLSAPGQAGTAQGYEMDVGMQYLFSPAVKFSLVGKNVMPASMGGKLTWSPTGLEETYPFFVRAGLKIDIEGGVPLPENSLSIGLEYDAHLREEAPNLMHLGLEWGIGEILDLRVGMDQGYIGRGGFSVFDVSNNMTYGVGVSYKGWRFDYAFHEYYNLADNNTSYFSLTYGLPYTPMVPVEEKRVEIVPEDKSIVYQPAVKVGGEVLDDKIKYIFIKDKYLDIIDGKFSREIDLMLGKNRVMVIGADDKKQEIFSERIRLLRLQSFQDVGKAYRAHDAVSALATLGIIKGYPGDMFKPENGITRAEFATLLARVAGYDKSKPVKKLPFKDLSRKHWAYGPVGYAVDKGLVKGYPDKTFKPNKKINRAEAITVVARFAGLDLDAAVDEIPYPDVPGRHWAVKGISAARSAGLLTHIKENFKPKQDISRGEVAAILAKVAVIKSKIDNLLNFERGYE